MRTKIITAAIGGLTYGAMLGWALTGDHLEAKAKRNRVALREVIKSQAEQLNEVNHENFELGEQVRTMASLLPAVEPVHVSDIRADDSLLEQPIEYDGEFQGMEDDSEATVVGTIEEVKDEEPPAFPEGETPEQTRTNLQKIIDQYAGSPEDSSFLVRATSREERERKEGVVPPKVISEAVYADSSDEEGGHFSKITLTYYPVPNVVLDDGDEPIAQGDIDSMLGWRNLRQFGFEASDPDIVYIRNFRTECDYEVVRDAESELPLHVKWGMDKESFNANKAAGLINFERGASD